MSAKAMFKRLGYELLMEDNNCIVWVFPNSGTLYFWKHSCTVSFSGFVDPYNEFDKDELCAIIKQLNEIGGKKSEDVSC